MTDSFINPVKYARSLIKVKYQTDEVPTRIVYLNRRACVVSYLTFCLVVNL